MCCFANINGICLNFINILCYTLDSIPEDKHTVSALIEKANKDAGMEDLHLRKEMTNDHHRIKEHKNYIKPLSSFKRINAKLSSVKKHNK